jgi:hypothetical protein
LDYHTLELGIACFETESLERLENKPLCSRENNVKTVLILLDWQD